MPALCSEGRKYLHLPRLLGIQNPWEGSLEPICLLHVNGHFLNQTTIISPLDYCNILINLVDESCCHSSAHSWIGHIVSLIITFQQVYIALQLKSGLFTMTDEAFCDVDSALLSSLIFPCPVPKHAMLRWQSFVWFLRRAMRSPALGRCGLVILLAGKLLSTLSLVHQHLCLQKTFLICRVLVRHASFMPPLAFTQICSIISATLCYNLLFVYHYFPRTKLCEAGPLSDSQVLPVLSRACLTCGMNTIHKCLLNEQMYGNHINLFKKCCSREAELVIRH